MTSNSIRLFYSYSHNDEKLRDQLEKHLSILQRQGIIASWHDRKIDAGENWKDKIDAYLNTAQIILLLISPDFLASDFCYDVEMKQALKRHEEGEARVIPIILRPTDWTKAPFSNLQALPKNAKPITKWSNHDSAFENIARGIREVAEELLQIAEAQEIAKAQGNLSSSPLYLVPRKIPAMQQLWNISQFRNPRFIGREDILERIRIGFTSNPDNLCVQILYGLGGIGKSQIVIEFAYHQAEDYDVVWWIRAEDPTSLAADYASIAQEMRLPEPVLKTEVSEKAEGNRYLGVVRRWLEKHKGWLLIFDNAVDLSGIRQYLPQKGSGHILITSRNPIWRGISEPIAVERLDRASSMDFLLKRTGLKQDMDADALAQELGDLPLALEQAGAYIEETGISYSDYLNLFYVQRQEILQRGTLSTDYPNTVATTWLISFQKVEKDFSAGSDLLNLCAFFAPDDIPLSMLKRGKQHLPRSLAGAAKNQIIFTDAVKALRRYSLVRVSDDALSIHRLVQAVVIDRLTVEEKRGFAESSVNIADDAFSFRGDDKQSIQECLRLLPHAMTAAGHGEESNVAREVVGKLLNKVALYLAGSKHFIESKAMFQRALKILEQAHGPGSPNLANALNNLGYVQRILNELEEAKLSHERALLIDESIYGTDHHEIALDLYNLAVVLVDLDARDEALTHFNRALEICVKNLGEDHPDTEFIRQNLKRLQL